MKKREEVVELKDGGSTIIARRGLYEDTHTDFIIRCEQKGDDLFILPFSNITAHFVKHYLGDEIRIVFSNKAVEEAKWKFAKRINKETLEGGGEVIRGFFPEWKDKSGTNPGIPCPFLDNGDPEELVIQFCERLVHVFKDLGVFEDIQFKTKVGKKIDNLDLNNTVVIRIKRNRIKLYRSGSMTILSVVVE